MGKERNQGIDILRGIACLLVAVYHYYQFRGTYIAVIVFFALSGYLTTESLLGKEVSYWDYCKKKIEKLYPLLLFVISIAACGVYYLEKGFGEHFRYGAISSIFGLSNIYQSFSKISYFEGHSEILPLIHTWALSLEIQFYLLFPLLFIVLQKWKRTEKEIAEIFFLLANLSAISMFFQYIRGTDLSRIYYGTDTRVFSFFLAAALASYMKGKEIAKEKKYFVFFLAGLGLLSILLFSFCLDYSSEWNYLGALYLASIFISFTILACLKLGFLQKLSFVGKVLSYLGERGYSYYLWQYVLMIFANEIFKWTRISYHVSVGLQFLCLIVLSEISYHTIEKRRWKSLWIGMFSLVVLLALFFAPKSQTQELDLMKESVQKVVEKVSVKQEELEKKNTESGKERVQRQEIEKVADNQLGRILAGSQVEQARGEEVLRESPFLRREESLQKQEEQEFLQAVEEEQTLPPSLGQKSTEPITFIGDSVMKMAEGEIQKQFPKAYVDAKVSRQFLQLPEILNHLQAQGKLHHRIVIHLGSNGPIREKSYQKVKEMLRGHEVYFMNAVVAKSWERDVNALLAKETSKEEDFHLIDWYGYAKGKSQWFYKDATHPKPNGAKKYVEFILQEVEK